MEYLGGVVDDAVLRLGDVVAFVSWVKHELAKVVSQSGFVELKTFLASIFAAMVDVDADRASELHSKSDRLDLSQGESLSESWPVAVSNGLASDVGSQSIEWPGRDGCGFCSSGNEPASLATGLVEPDSDVALPVLAKVDVGDDVVVLNH